MEKKPLSDMTNTELWQLFPIEVCCYRADWPAWYAEETAFLRKLLGTGTVLCTYHIGSTSVPGLSAKPIVDLILEISPAYSVEALKKQMLAAGYLYNDRADEPAPHLTFLKGYTPDGFADRVFHIHIRYPGDHAECRFRDYLRSHPDTASEYERLKQKLAKQFQFDRDAYTAAKSDFIQKVDTLAGNI